VASTGAFYPASSSYFFLFSAIFLSISSFVKTFSFSLSYFSMRFSGIGVGYIVAGEDRFPITSSPVSTSLLSLLFDASGTSKGFLNSLGMAIEILWLCITFSSLFSSRGLCFPYGILILSPVTSAGGCSPFSSSSTLSFGLRFAAGAFFAFRLS
jgi:hypothetical protein